jgi:hypothetical protein
MLSFIFVMSVYFFFSELQTPTGALFLLPVNLVEINFSLGSREILFSLFSFTEIIKAGALR